LDFATFAFQNVPPAPGRAGDPGAGTVQQPAGGPESAPGPSPEGGIFGILPLLLFIPLLIFLFWSSRSQQKKQDATIASLKKGDRVLTQSGLVGRLLEVDQRYAKLELSPGVKVTVLRTSLIGRDTEESSGKKAEPAGDKKAETSEKDEKKA
jgi:preprotein translocase subunit YajC